MSEKGKTSEADKTLPTDKTKDIDQIFGDSEVTAGDHIVDSSEMTDDDNLIYDWENCETLQIVKAFTITDYGTKSDDDQQMMSSMCQILQYQGLLIVQLVSKRLNPEQYQTWKRTMWWMICPVYHMSVILR